MLRNDNEPHSQCLLVLIIFSFKMIDSEKRRNRKTQDLVQKITRIEVVSVAQEVEQVVH